METITEKFVSLMARPSQENVPKDDVPWYLKYGARVLGIIGAFFCVTFGLWNCVSIIAADVSCLVSGILQVCLGLFVIVVEAPCCCMFVDSVQKIADLADSKPYWYRAALYCVCAILPVILCLGLASLFACGLIFGTGVLYGLMSLGKKASLQDMRNAAVASDNSRPVQTTSGMRSNLVDNAQPVAFTGPPAYDSNV